MSVVRLAARHVRSKAGAGKSFVLVGYSNGGALAVKYAQDVIEGSGLPRPDRIVLMSPMIGVTPFAGLARVREPPPPHPFLREERVARRPARVQPVQVQLVPGERRPPDVGS